MTIEEMMRENLVGKKIILNRYTWNKKPDDLYNRWAIPGDSDNSHYRKSKDFTRVEDDVCLITGVCCDYDSFEGSSLAIVVSCGEKKGNIFITPFTKLEFIE